MKTLCLIFGIIMSINLKAQEVSVEKTIYGIQTGLLGVWVNNETRLINTVALSTEFGLNSKLFGGSFYASNVNIILYPSFSFEPRIYYNLKKRISKGYSVKKNSGNYVGLKFNYIPNWFVISNLTNVQITPNISVVPKWAIKRTLGDHFTYETGIGIGLRFFNKNTSKKNEKFLDLHMRLGYIF